MVAQRNHANDEALLDSIDEHTETSTRMLGAKQEYYRTVKQHQLRPFHVTPVQELLLQDLPKRMAFIKLHLQGMLSLITIITSDKDNPYGKITTERGILVKKTLIGELEKTILSASYSKTKSPTFRSWSHSGKIIRVTCDDDLTLEWLKMKVPTIKTWKGATLAVVRMDELPKLTKTSLWIPEEAQADLNEN
ncbi:unnamed protein product [Psylliodes chrysocephalus]|uniref:DUF4780 domain-containing protein n=1 Tax=Psylliodes chrysocephalus TaxID=3402493 RepID=A0A9P0GFR2_9CUCU|nr:unnamed protein product [Psylliodes chrysocephala]